MARIKVYNDAAPVAHRHRAKFLNGSLLFQYKYFTSGEARFGAVVTEADMHVLSLGARFF